MPKFRYFLGRKIGNLSIISSKIKKNDRLYYLCRCSCGRKKLVRYDHLRSGAIDSCGHDKSNPIHVGQRINNLTVIAIKRIRNKLFCECRCVCGKVILVTYGNLRSGHTKSCGCLKLGASKETRKKKRGYPDWLINELCLESDKDRVRDKTLTFAMPITLECPICHRWYSRDLRNYYHSIKDNKPPSRVCSWCKHKKDINIGDKFGEFIVIGSKQYVDGKYMYLCRCSCGREKLLSERRLLSGNTKTCGSYHSGRIPVIGEVFGRLTVLSFYFKKKDKKYYCTCRCTCGNVKDVVFCNLYIGHTKSCGCGEMENKVRLFGEKVLHKNDDKHD